MADNDIAEDPAVEAQARDMGWTPEAEYKGKGPWKPAAEYVEYASQVLPLVNATNKRLRGELAAVRQETQQIKTLLATSQQAIEDLNKFHTEETARQVAEVKRDLAARLKTARADGDTDAEVEIQVELGKLTTAQTAAEAKPAAKPAAATIDTSAETSWRTDNSWYGGTSAEDKRKTRFTVVLANELAEERKDLNGQMPAFYAELDKRIAAETGGASARPGDSKVAGGSSGGGAESRGGGGSRNFASLPADAKAAAKSFERELVGPNKQHKTLDDFHKAWVAEYYRQEDKRNA